MIARGKKSPGDRGQRTGIKGIKKGALEWQENVMKVIVNVTDI